ncbi:hypothetical protein [Novispirillum itersonii]|uniref:hypothetical protein n=1 Tax=Novispirillum itersonii TaxID=189 RepID=UPI0012DC01A6|nr:hypothetical protein [Novispirillum itersonii]
MINESKLSREYWQAKQRALRVIARAFREIDKLHSPEFREIAKSSVDEPFLRYVKRNDEDKPTPEGGN